MPHVENSDEKEKRAETRDGQIARIEYSGERDDYVDFLFPNLPPSRLYRVTSSDGRTKSPERLNAG